MPTSDTAKDQQAHSDRSSHASPSRSVGSGHSSDRYLAGRRPRNSKRFSGRSIPTGRPSLSPSNESAKLARPRWTEPTPQPPSCARSSASPNRPSCTAISSRAGTGGSRCVTPAAGRAASQGLRPAIAISSTTATARSALSKPARRHDFGMRSFAGIPMHAKACQTPAETRPANRHPPLRYGRRARPGLTGS